MKLIIIVGESPRLKMLVVASQSPVTMLGVFPIPVEKMYYGDGYAFEESAGIVVDNL